MSKDILRGNRLEPIASNALKYTSSIDEDEVLFEPVKEINIAHVIALLKAGAIEKEKAEKIVSAIKMVNKFDKDAGFEDVHMLVEQRVIELVGEDGGYINLGKSRNDQVSTALRIVLRKKILEIIILIVDFMRTLLERAKEVKDNVMPAYTHLQVAQPITFAYWLLSYHDMIRRDVERLFENYVRTNMCPMGAAACAGTTINIDREDIAKNLAFYSIIENTVDAVSSRDFILEHMFILSSIMLHLSRMCEDIIFLSNNDIGILNVPDKFSSTSSAMPQKKNSVVAEVARAYTGIVTGNFFGIMCLYKSLPLSYNLDLQEITPKVWETYNIVYSTIEVIKDLISEIGFNEERSYDILVKNFSNAMELAEKIVIYYKTPFRKAHHIVGAYVRKCLEKNVSPLSKEAYQIFCEELNRENVSPLPYDEYMKTLDPKTSIFNKNIEGGPNPGNIISMIKEREKQNFVIKEIAEKELSRIENVRLKLNLYDFMVSGGDRR
ncbi:MAG: argininosuccinate lyase [Nitrososphaeria archaeon]|nr:argininosuccinate lyase [Nitrososphaeria archaeon]